MSNNQNKGEKKCEKCKGAGWYQYSRFNGDTPHSTICDECCTHSKGFWELKEHYGERNGKMCCLNGCGFTREKEEWEDKLIEKMAEMEHIRWAKWQNYLHSFLTWNNEIQAWVLPHEKKDHWQMQIHTPYQMLSEKEKESDRDQVKPYLPLIQSQKHLSYNQGVADGKLEIEQVISKHNARILNEFQKQGKPDMPFIAYDERICLIPAMKIATDETLAILKDTLSNQVGENK